MPHRNMEVVKITRFQFIEGDNKGVKGKGNGINDLANPVAAQLHLRYTLTKYNSLNPVDLLECTKGSHYVSNNLILSGHGNKMMQERDTLH